MLDDSEHGGVQFGSGLGGCASYHVWSLSQPKKKSAAMIKTILIALIEGLLLHHRKVSPDISSNNIHEFSQGALSLWQFS